MMDSKVTVFLVVMLLAILRGLMQRSKVRREIEERNARILTPLQARRLKNRHGPVVESPKNGMDEIEDDDDDTESTDTDSKSL